MIEVQQLTKSYGGHLAVDHVTFSAGSREVLGLLGPNGAGKSTIMRILAGYLTATDGEAVVAGFPVGRASRQVRERLGYLTDAAGLHGELRVGEYLRYRASIRGLWGASRKARIDAALATCSLGEVERRIVGQLSRGYRQRVCLAAALLHDPPVLILDEPTSGLDPIQCREFRELVRRLGRERTVLFSTHVLPEAEAVCGRLLILDRGRIRATGTPAELLDRHRSNRLAVELHGGAAAATAALLALGGVEVEVEREAPTAKLLVRTSGAATAEERARIARALAGAGCLVIGLGVDGGSLDDVFARLTLEPEAAA